MLPSSIGMTLPTTLIQSTTSSLLASSSLPAARALVVSNLALLATRGGNIDDDKTKKPVPADNNGQSSRQGSSSIMVNPFKLPPRARSVFYMGAAMSLHFGGYEFFRNSCLALFTSSEYGFKAAAAYPLANGLISPFSLLLLWGYGRQLDAHGPRGALFNTTLYSIAFIATASVAIYTCHTLGLPLLVSQAILGVTFLFQSSYQYLLYTQQWSFVGSVLTPEEGSRWFATLAGASSLLSSICGSIIPVILPRTGLAGLMAVTCLTLSLTLTCADRAYDIAQKNDVRYDRGKKKESDKGDAAKTADDDKNQSRVVKAVKLFRRVPPLAALFFEVLSFQSLNTILNVAFVRGMKANIPDDMARSAYSGRFFSLVNAVSATLQFLVLPTFMKFAEPAWVWRLMPVIPLGICIFQFTSREISLTLLAAAFFLSKVMDYSLRSVVSVMVYQPLDFESRYVGKEIIGVFGSRFGKSGMSLILSGLTALGLTSLRGLNNLALVAVGMWFSSTLWISQIIPRKAEAQAAVEAEQQRGRERNNDATQGASTTPAEETSKKTE